MNVKLVWVLPTVRVSGKPLLPADIKHVKIDVSANGGQDWSPVGEFPASVLEADVTDLDFGTWHFRGVVVDTKDRESPPLVAVLENEDTSPPSALVSLELAPL